MAWLYEGLILKHPMVRKFIKKSSKLVKNYTIGIHNIDIHTIGILRNPRDPKDSKEHLSNNNFYIIYK